MGDRGEIPVGNGIQAGTRSGVETGIEAGARSGIGAGTRGGVGTGIEAGARGGVGNGTEAGARSGIGAGARSGVGNGIEAGARSGVETRAGTGIGGGRHALVTGGAGFIGSHLVDGLLAEGWRVSVVDNFDGFYDPSMKERNVARHGEHEGYTLHRLDIRDLAGMRAALDGDYDVIVHLAAKAGVRPSIEDPLAYQAVNVAGTQNMLEFARERGIRQFVFASSSSVYGVNPDVPWREEDHVLLPISPYASTKVSGELLGHVYSHLYGLRFVALRFFTVYGPRQRPDLAIHKFARLMLEGKALPFYGDGETRRDYTYVDDVVQGVRAAMEYDASPYEVINLGNNRTVSLDELVGQLEAALGLRATLDRQPDQPGDVPQTWADVTKAASLLGYRPTTDLAAGLARFVGWLRGAAGSA